MRRSVQPNWPRAMTCCFFASLKRLAMTAQGPRSPSPRQRLERLPPMAGFQLSIYGRFWVSTEAWATRNGNTMKLRFSSELASPMTPGHRQRLGQELLGADAHVVVADPAGGLLLRPTRGSPR